jgi:hypothetical protein
MTIISDKVTRPNGRVDKSHQIYENSKGLGLNFMSNSNPTTLNQMNKAHSLSFIIFAVSSTALLNAAVIAEWTFNAGANSTARLASSGVPAGATISGLSFNSSFTDVGPGAVPNDVHDGFGFGGNAGDQVIFLHRANYFRRLGSP